MDSTGDTVDQMETGLFLKNLERFPHLFQLQRYKDLKRARLESIRDRLRDEKTEAEDLHRNSVAGYGKLQRSRDSNVIAFTSFLLDDYDTSKSESERVLQDDPYNVVTLVNLAVFAWERGSRVEAEERLQTLKDVSCLPDFGDRCVEAKAELAYCYSRMGPSYTGLAVSQFEEVVELRPLEFDWKLGLAMTLTRAIRPNQRMYHGTGGQAAIQKAHQAVDLFLEVKQSHAADNLKAQAATQLGLLWEKHVGQDYDLQRRIQDYCKLQSVSPQRCFEDALRLAPNDSSTLTKCGQYFYRIGQLLKAESILEQAIAIRQTTIAHDILGLIYYKMVHDYVKKAHLTKKKKSARNMKRGQKGRRRKTSTLHQIPRLQEDAEYTGNVDFEDEVPAASSEFSFCHNDTPNGAPTYTRPFLNGRDQIPALTMPYDLGNVPTGMKETKRRLDVDKIAPTENIVGDMAGADTEASSRAGHFRNMNDFDTSEVAHAAALLSAKCKLGSPMNEGVSLQTSKCNAGVLESDTVSDDRKKRSHKQRRQKGGKRTPPGGTITAVGQTEASPQSFTDISHCKEITNILEEAGLPRHITILAEKSVRQFKLSIELAHDDNDTAHLHLARLYMILDLYHKTLDECKHIMGQEKSKNSPSERIQAYELAGQCNLKLSEIEQDCQRKEKLKEEAHKLLKVALSVQCHYAKQVPEYNGYFGKRWHSFHTLMKAIQNDTTSSDGDKQKERAVLLHMIGKYSDSLQIIQDISQYTRDEAIDPKIFEMKLHCYIGLKQYDEAVTFLRILSMTDQRYIIQNLNELWMQTHILAAREALLFHGDMLACKHVLVTGGEDVGAEIAKAYFLLAFYSRFSPSPFQRVCGNNNEPATTQSYTALDDKEGSFPIHDWHVMILYDPDDLDMERKAATIKHILKNVCGLNVMSMFDVHPGANERLESLNNVEKSLLAILLVGAENRPDAETFRQMYLEPTLEVLSSGYSCLREFVVLLTDSDHPPCSLKLARPAFRCPPVLLAGDLPSPFGDDPFANAEISIFAKEKVLATCDLFCAMVGVSIREFPY